MIIKYTKNRIGNFIINSIEDVPTWGEIQERYGLEVKVCYLASFPFVNFYNNELFLYLKETDIVSIKIGEEYEESYFIFIKDLISESDKRLREIINYIEEEEVWDSSLHPIY